MSQKETPAVTNTDSFIGDGMLEVTNPGLPPHAPRLTDVSEGSRRRNERTVVFFFVLSIVGSIGFVVAYFTFPNGHNTQIGTLRLANLFMGLAIACMLLGIGIGIIQWARALMPDHELVEERHEQVTFPEQEKAEIIIDQVINESGIKRRPLLRNALIGAMALAPVSGIFLLGDLNTRRTPVAQLSHTKWARGVYLVKDGQGFSENARIRAEDVTSGSAFHVLPDSLNPDLPENKNNPDFNFLNEKSKAIVLLMRLDAKELKVSPGRENWNHNGIVAYSKVCTHVGCPIALYEHTTHHLLCPCHQSTFDVTEECKVIFGPAKRPLPQLPITVDSSGYLIARSDFREPVGPSYWERVEGTGA